MPHAEVQSTYDYSNLPAWIRAAKRFLVWRLVPDAPGKKPKKIPYYVNGKARGRTDVGEDTALLATFDEAMDVLRRRPGAYQGLGFALGADGTGAYWQGIDLDDLPANVHLQGEVEGLVGYVEHSPSGRGVHAIGYGPDFAALGSDGSGVEAYCRNRFFTVTGKAIKNSGPEDLSRCVFRLVSHRRLQNAVMVDARAPKQIDWDCCFDMSDERSRELRSALAYIDPDPYDTWVSMAYALKGGGEDAFEIWDEWSARSPKYDPEAARRLWDAADPKKTSVGAVFKRAESAGWPNPRKLAGHPAREGWATGAANDPCIDPEFEFKSAADLMAELAPPKWLVEGLIEEGALGMLFGEPGLGKSFLALDWSCCVATGAPWLGRAVAQGPVFYIAGEGHSGIGRRLAAWNARNEPDLSLANLYVSRTAAALVDILSASRVASAVEQLAVNGPPKLVVIDTFHRNLGGGDENSAEDVAAFLTHVDQLIRKKFDCAILIVHHSGHSEKSRARGSSSIIGAMDFILQLSSAGGRLKLSCEKQKDGEPAQDLYLALERVDLTFLSNSLIGSSQVIVASTRPTSCESLSETLAGRSLQQAIDEAGAAPQPDPALPADVVRVTTEEDWRSRYVAGRAADGIKPDSAARDFARKKKSLLESGAVGQHERWVWICGEF